jgi:hypothetical protein
VWLNIIWFSHFYKIKCRTGESKQMCKKWHWQCLNYKSNFWCLSYRSDAYLGSKRCFIYKWTKCFNLQQLSNFLEPRYASLRCDKHQIFDLKLHWNQGKLKGGSITVPLTSGLTGLDLAVRWLTIFLFVRLIQTSQTEGQWYSDPSLLSILWLKLFMSLFCCPQNWQTGYTAEHASLLI